jgi:hypothetical protein
VELVDLVGLVHWVELVDLVGLVHWVELAVLVRLPSSNPPASHLQLVVRQ